MNGVETEDVSQILSETLILALNQSRDLSQAICDKDNAIERLTKENATMRLEILELKKHPMNNLVLDAKVTAQIDHLFQQVAEKQAELDRLNAKWRTIRVQEERNWRLLNRSESSPGVTHPNGFPDVSDLAPQPLKLTTSEPPDTILKEQSSAHPSLKEKLLAPLETTSNKRFSEDCPANERKTRARVDNQELEKRASIRKGLRKERAGNGVNKQTRRPAVWKARGTAAIISVTEDGEDHYHNGSNSGPRSEGLTDDESDDLVHRRLRNLLATPGSPSPLLQVCNVPHQSFKRSLSSPPSRLQPPFRGPESNVPATGLAPIVRKAPFLPPRQRSAPAPEDEEPYRSRPLRRLNLSHFKLNPRNPDIRHTERSCSSGCTHYCCRGGRLGLIAVRHPDASKVSTNDVLLDFLGPGSENMIKTLTPLAKENLVHEARIKSIARSFGHGNNASTEREESPPGFWDTDFRGTQEERENQEQIKQKEQEEIEWRFQEAHKENGKWMFADE